MNKIGLTQRQADLLAFIESRASDGLLTPSFDEMRSHLGLKAKSGVHRIITGLEERGHIVRLHNRARSIQLVERQDASKALLDEPRITVDARVADRLDAYCRRHRMKARDVIALALTVYMQVHP